MSTRGTRFAPRTLTAVPQNHRHLSPEDWGRLIGYTMGTVWATVFGLWPPTQYQGVISLLAVHAWSVLMGAGCLAALFGTLTGRDLKIELSGIYLVLIGALLYVTAQVGFSGAMFTDRIPFLVFIVWHISMLLPRLFGLESERRRRHAIAKVRL